MNWFGWVMLPLILGGAVWVYAVLDRAEGGDALCRGCGRCAYHGACVLTGKDGKSRKKAEKSS